jgi:hypothetical protein
MDLWTAQIIKMALFCGSMVSCVAIVVLARRRPPRRDDEAMREISARLERMEQAVDTIAIEVERVSEGQRFTSKLLADRETPRSPLKQVTPH